MFTNNSKRLSALTGVLFLTPLMQAWAEPWDNSLQNPYVAAGWGAECTAYSWGRYVVDNLERLRFTGGTYPNANLMYTNVVETPTSYRSSTPVRGALISWAKPGTFGHTAHVEKLYSDGRAYISEQNWPIGTGPRNWTLTAAQLQSRGGYTLVGYVNPNRPPAFGTIAITKGYSSLQVGIPVLDEDGNPVSLLVGVVNGGQAVPGMSISASVRPNQCVNLTFSNTSQLVRGRSYSLNVWGWDSRGLRATKANSFIW